MAKKTTAKTTAKLERIYNIPLRSSFRNTAKHKKTPKAVRAVKIFLEKHMKAEKVLLGGHLNEAMWLKGIKNPPHHVKVKAVLEDGVVKAELEGKNFKGAAAIEKKKEAPTSMKEKLAEKLGVDDASLEKAEKEEAKAKGAEEKKEAPKATPKVAPTAPKPAAAKPVVKPAEKPKVEAKKPEVKAPVAKPAEVKPAPKKE